MIKRTFISSFLLLTSCGVESEDGVGTSDSCVPAEYRVPHQEWVPRTPNLTDSGIAFAGCWGNTLVHECSLPEAIFDGAIYRGNAPKRVLREMPVNAFYRDISLDQTSSVIHDVSANVLVVENPTFSDKWLIWQSQSSSPSDRVGEFDELSAVCGYAQIMRNGIYEKEIICERVIEVNNSYVKSHFWSPTRVPSGLLKLDQGLLSTLEKWGCLDPSEKSKNEETVK